ncbi:MAG: hypothetical protein K0Q49_1978 [Haloplasmataceae bacterium]|nr:hypothetical protein [Haloplasmataceae bacterium]
MSEENNISSSDQFQMVLKSVMNLPGVRIVRLDFLLQELSKKFPVEIVDKAILFNPLYAGIHVNDLETIATNCINHETNQVTVISTVAGIPEELSILGTVTADTLLYIGHIIRIVQKLIYLYGWNELYISSREFDDEIMNQLTLFIGIMFGVHGATSAICRTSYSKAAKLEKTQAQKDLIKTTIDPIVNKVATLLDQKLTKEISAKGVSKAVPESVGVITGMTYLTFKPKAKKLKNYLKTLPNATNDYVDLTEEDLFIEIE